MVSNLSCLSVQFNLIYLYSTKTQQQQPQWAFFISNWNSVIFYESYMYVSSCQLGCLYCINPSLRDIITYFIHRFILTTFTSRLKLLILCTFILGAAPSHYVTLSYGQNVKNNMKRILQINCLKLSLHEQWTKIMHLICTLNDFFLKISHTDCLQFANTGVSVSVLQGASFKSSNYFHVRHLLGLHTL